jgi:hypothetical protein
MVGYSSLTGCGRVARDAGAIPGGPANRLQGRSLLQEAD